MKHTEESIQSLRFAQRVKKIKNKAKSNIQKSPEQMMQLIEKLKEEVFMLNKKLELIRLSPENVESIINMDNHFVMQQIMGGEGDVGDGAGAQDDENHEDDDVPPFLKSPAEMNNDPNNVGESTHDSSNADKSNQLDPANFQTP